MRISYIAGLWSVLAGVALLAAGCGQSGQPDGTAENARSAPDAGDGEQTSAAAEQGGHNLDGWWCTEHGVPEGECARCDSTLIAQFKADGDWCDEHDRPVSQCFICNPARFDGFAKRYEAKFGKQPPKPTE